MDDIKNETDPIRKAHAIKDLHDNSDISYSAMAKELGVSPTYISNYLRLLRLPPLVLDGFYTGTLSVTHLFIMSRLKDENRIIQLYEDTLARNLSVLELEEEVRALLYGMATEGVRAKPSTIEAIQRKFLAIDPSVKVKVIQTRIKSKVVVELAGNQSKTTTFLERLSEE